MKYFGTDGVRGIANEVLAQNWLLSWDAAVALF